MKKKTLVAAIGLSLILGLTGCNSGSTEAESETTEEVTTEAITEDVTTEETTEAAGPTITEPAGPAVEAAASSWAVVAEKEYDFASYLIGYYDESLALSVGYNGEIHYMNADASDWPQADNTSLCRYGMDIVDGTTIYTCGNGGHVTKSTDGGKTFAKVTNFGGSEPNQCSMLSFIDADNGIIASASDFAITADGGQAWKELEAPADIASIRMVSPDEFYVIGKDFNLYKTVDGGSTWAGTPMNLPLGDAYVNNPRSLAISIDGENAYTVFCIEKDSKTVKSYSTADNWFSFTENTLPEITDIGKSYFYLNHDATIVTLTDTKAKKATAMKKQ